MENRRLAMLPAKDRRRESAKAARRSYYERNRAWLIAAQVERTRARFRREPERVREQWRRGSATYRALNGDRVRKKNREFMHEYSRRPEVRERQNEYRRRRRAEWDAAGVPRKW